MNLGKTFPLLAIIVVVVSLATALPTFATDYNVHANSDCAFADAIKAANSDSAVGNCPAGQGDDTIVLTSNITLDANLPDVTSNLTVKSHNGTKHTISGAGAYYIFNIDMGGNLTLKVLQLMSGRFYGARGGAVRVLQGHASLSDVRLEDNWAELGGGALRVGNGSSANCNMCQFVDNNAPIGGAIWVGDEGSSIVLNNSMVYNNTAERGGGMYIKHGSATIAGTSFANNSAAEGPDLLSEDAELTLQPSANIDARGIVRR